MILVGTAVWLAYETKGLLIGESANQAVVQGIREMANDIDVVEYVNEVQTMHMGPDFMLVNMSVDFRDSVSADEVERVIGGMNGMIKQHFSRVKRIVIEDKKCIISNS
ncbi:MAG: hypothetical protein AB2764_16865 [Candidatus Thiodiazotropha endolucinida]